MCIRLLLSSINFKERVPGAAGGQGGLFVCLVWSGGLPRRFFVMHGTLRVLLVSITGGRPPLIIETLINIIILAAKRLEMIIFPIIQEYTEISEKFFRKFTYKY